MLIVKPFNPVFCGMFLLCVVLAFLTGKAPRKVCKKIIILVNVIGAVWLLLYKNLLFLDPEYVEICLATKSEIPSVWTGLPFHFCNMLLFITPFALWKENKRLLAFVCVSCIYSTGAALFMPSSGFSGYSLLLPRVLSYYCIHFAGLYSGFAILFSRLYEPDYKDILPTYGYTLLCYTIAFLVSFTLVKLHLSETVNYFYSMGPRNNAVLRFFYRLIPMPYFYFIPFITLFSVPTTLLTALYRLGKKAVKKHSGRC